MYCIGSRRSDNFLRDGLSGRTGDQRPSAAFQDFFHDQNDAILRREREAATNRNRLRTRRAHEIYLRKQRGEYYFHFVESKCHPEARSAAAPERKPFMARILPF